ncbi:PTS galactitol transporter subunit IIC [Anaerorhabdus sp.]|uniref:PTS galactitol transporter subunit IIC n=1 Tax=Anaerorhabdus sp. TaxID=1872524 RepID=UPI002FC638D5
MNAILDIIYAGFQTILNAGSLVMLPIIITLIGLVFGVKFSKAFKSGITIAIGFAGINLVVNLLKSNIGPAAQAMVQNFGINLDIIDVGWGAIASVTWASPIIAILVFEILFINVVMLTLKLTDTMDVDIWNYHHMAIVGIMVYFATNSVFLAMGACAVMAVITFKFSDWTQPLVEKYFGIPDVSLPTVSAVSSVIIAAPMNWLIDRIPVINKIDFSVSSAKKYLGFFGEPMMLGIILGVGIGLLAKYDLAQSFNLGVNMAAVMVLIPKMTSLFMEGLMPISEAAKKFCQKRFKGRKLFIGLDAAVVVGNENVITTSLILTPLVIALAVILPGNRVLPFADLAVLTFRVALVVAICKGNLFRSIIIGLVTMAAVLLAGTITSPVLTALATSVGLQFDGGIASFAATALTESFLVFEAFTRNPMISVPVLLVVFGSVWFFMSKKKKAVQTEEN